MKLPSIFSRKKKLETSSHLENFNAIYNELPQDHKLMFRECFDVFYKTLISASNLIPENSVERAFYEEVLGSLLNVPRNSSKVPSIKGTEKENQMSEFLLRVYQVLMTRMEETHYNQINSKDVVVGVKEFTGPSWVSTENQPDKKEI